MEYLVDSERRSVRKATLGDLPRLMRLSKEFYDASPYNGRLTFDESKLKNVLKMLISSDDSIGTIFIGTKSQGLLACMGVEPFFSTDRVATEVMWWVSPQDRGSGIAQELIEAYEGWCRLHGYRMAQMVLLDALKGSSVDRFYTKKGYELTEKAYIKVLQ